MQVNFSARSMAEIERLEHLARIETIGRLGDLRREQFLGAASPEHVGKIRRGKRTYYRIRIGDLRFYFEFTAEGILCHHILRRHTFEDFCFRCGLSPQDDGRVEGEALFWHFLEGEDAAGEDIATEDRAEKDAADKNSADRGGTD